MANTLKFGNGQWATKEGSTLAYNDENGNFKPLPFEFTRASSATRVGRNGLIETVGSNVPRIDFKDDSNGALKLEPQRTNFIPYSTLDFNGGSKPEGWSIGFGTGSYSYEQLEYKGQKAVKQTQITTGRSYLDTGTITILANTEYNLKIQFILDECVADDNDIICSVNGFGVFQLITFSQIDSNGILNINFTSTTTTTGSIRVGLGTSANEDGGKSLAWAIPQLEQGSYATSYIPTQGSQVTRVVDACSQTPPSGIIGQTEGVMYLDFILNTDTISTKWLSFLGDGSQYIGIYVVNTSNVIRLEVSNTTNQATFNSSFPITKGTRYKCAIAYANNDFTAYINGVQIGTDNSGTVPSTTTLRNYYNLNNIESTIINDLQLYNTRLSNTELQTLTTL